jgi:6-phosphofructo-2-kinase/fructose-2,6-biphosphatase 4
LKPKVFSLGDHRRKVLGPSSNLPPDYFSPKGRSPETEILRKKVLDTLEADVIKFFKENRGQVAIYDANNGKRVTRRDIRNRFEAMGINVFFIGNVLSPNVLFWIRFHTDTTPMNS